MSDYVMAKIAVSGDPTSLASFRDQHLSHGAFDFNSIIPTPPELMIEESSAPETGYHALYGDWKIPAKAWTWKAAAGKLGFPFPLESRDQVIACINSYENPGFYFDGAEQYKMNMEKHGCFTWYGWCEKHWGTKSNAEDAAVNDNGQLIEIRFASAYAFPAPVFKALSEAFPSLEFDILTLDEVDEKPEGYVLQNGRRVRESKVSKRQAKKALSFNAADNA